MDRNEILAKLQEICRDVFDDDELVISDEMTSEDIDGWESLTHLSLISEIEDEFEINLTLKETSKSSSIGELVSAIQNHIA